MAKQKTHTKKGLKPPKKHSHKHHAHVYWPYIPLILLLIGASFINIWQPLQRASNNSATLAYATSMSRSALLSSTNSERSNVGAASLTLNSQLNAAAQAKANDMVARDYWSHDTPDGEKPWVFIDAQGYSYQKAGENLAYGFATSADTIVGWMNSPSHRENMLDTAYTEVGFGFADSANFVSNGQNTVVVAMYAKPTASAPAPPAPEPVETQEVQQSTVTTPTPEPEPVVEPEPEPEPEEVVEEPEPIVEEVAEVPVSTATPESTEQVEEKQITLLQQLSNGSVPVWTVTALSMIGLGLSVLWLIKHAVAVKRIIIEGEHFVAHHPIFDLIVVSIIALIIYLSQTTGVIL